MGNLNTSDTDEVESIRSSLLDEASRNSEESFNIEDLLEMETELRERGFTNEQIYRAYSLGATNVEAAIRILAEEDFYSGNPADCKICSRHEALEGIGHCQHAFCKDCLESYIEFKVSEAQVLNMTCPSHACTTSLSDSLIRRISPAQVYVKYLQFKRNAELEVQPNVRFCPRPNCQGHAVVGLNSEVAAVCNICNFEFCPDCQEAWHPDSECPQLDEVAMVRYVKSHHVKECPNCKRRVEKVEGCDHMTCFKCKHEFCWLCGFPYMPKHFEQCPVILYRRKSPTWGYIGLLLIAPMLLPVAMPVLCLYYFTEIENEYKEDFVWLFSKRCRAKFLLAILSFLLTPIVVVFVLPIYTVFVVSKYLADVAEEQRLNVEARSCSSSLYLSSFIRGLVSLMSGLFVVPIAIVAAMLAHLLAWGWGSFKIYICLRRCCDPGFMKPTLSPGFTM